MRLFNCEIKLVIFDLDGTLIDSTSLWSDIDTLFFRRRNMEVPKGYSKAIAHLGLAGAAKYTRSTYFPNEKEEDILKEWKELSLEEYSKNIPLKEYAKELLELLKDNGVIIALATANSKELYEPCLKRLGIDKYFSLVVDVNSFERGKDSPEIYNFVTERFGVSKNETLIFEDMLLPIKTAHKEGYNVVAVYDKNSHAKEEELIENSICFIKSFKSIV